MTIGQTITFRFQNGQSVTGKIAVLTSRIAWLRLQSIQGYWTNIPDADDLFPVAVYL